MCIYEEFHRQRRVLLTEGKTPTQVVFSSAGYSNAMAEKDSLFGGFGPTMRPRVYGGLHFTIDPKAEADITVMAIGLVKSPVSFQVDFMDTRRTTMELAGALLSRAQLSDLLQAWVNAHPNEQPVTDMLVDWIQTYGRL